MKKRLVIKIGSDVLTTENGLSSDRINSLSKEISEIKNLGFDIILVSSGAIASGTKITGLLKRPREIAEKRALASVGQFYLMEAWIKAFQPVLVAQILLTWDDLSNEERKLKARETLLKILKRDIINENDAVADEEIRFSDNDQLALKVAKLIHAERLVFLTDVDGLFSKNPKHNNSAKLMTKVVKVDTKIRSMVEETKSDNGLGGMISKINIAEEALESDIKTNILNGEKNNLLLALIKDNKNLGTEFSRL